MKNSRWMVGLLALASGVVLADGALSRETLLQRVERCRQFEHAQDRREALDALKTRSGLSQDEWAAMLFDVATNRNDRFILNDVGRYASTNLLSRLQAVFTNANFNSSFRLAAFRAFAKADGFGERTASLVSKQSLKNKASTEISERDLLLQVRSLLPTNDAKCGSFERCVRSVREKEGSAR